jgi:hypothetical protein
LQSVSAEASDCREEIREYRLAHKSALINGGTSEEERIRMNECIDECASKKGAKKCPMSNFTFGTSSGGGK